MYVRICVYIMMICNLIHILIHKHICVNAYLLLLCSPFNQWDFSMHCININSWIGLTTSDVTIYPLGSHKFLEITLN